MDDVAVARKTSASEERYDPSKNKTSPVLTRYERAKLLGMRTEQIVRGSLPMIDMEAFVSERGEDAAWSSADIALEEMLQKRTPYIIVRRLPDGSEERWKVKDMVILS